MYIIRKGNVGVVGKHNQLMSILGPGDNFGEIALLTQVFVWGRIYPGFIRGFIYTG